MTTKTVLITGAGGDLGRAFTGVFGRAGYAVAGIDIDPAALDRFAAAAEAAGAEHVPLACDLREWSQIERAVTATAERFGRLDVVINNATARTSPGFKPLEDCTEAELAAIFATGPQAALGVMRASLPHLKATRGTVINIGSGAGLIPPPGLGPYAMAKAAMHALTSSAAREWGTHGITVNGILPYAMTGTLAHVIEANPEVMAKVAPPLGRIGDAETDIGAVALFLASPAADYITGQNIPVDGGLNMR
jgi:NAD(P)-dependent dehydrogenase (short-subunit alcohol dehydrogenase family)